MTAAPEGGVSSPPNGAVADRPRMAGGDSPTYDSATVRRLARYVGEQLSRHETSQADGGRRFDLDDRRMFARATLQQSITELNHERLGDRRQPLSNAEGLALADAVIDRLFGMGRLQGYIDNPDISDIYVNGADVVHLKWRDGATTEGAPVADSDAELIQLIQTQARRGRHEQRWDPAAPELNLQLPSGDRLHAIAWVSTRPSVSIRRHDFALNNLQQLVSTGTINDALCELLRAMVLARFNILVAGGTGAGKTTLLRCLINEIPAAQRLVTVEDSLELGVAKFSALHPNLVELEAREANVEGVGTVSMQDLVRAGLRMGPDRVIVGEIRGAEVVPMLLAMSQGNDGSMSTVHADSSAGAFSRVQMYLAMTPERFTPETANLMTANAVDVVVHLAQRDDKSRVVTSIREVTGSDGGVVLSNEIYAPDSSGRAAVNWRFEDQSLRRLNAAGFDQRWLDPTANGWAV